MPKRKMIEVGARRLDMVLDEYIDNIDGSCGFCPAFKGCKYYVFHMDNNRDYLISDSSIKDIAECKQYLKRWLTCQK